MVPSGELDDNCSDLTRYFPRGLVNNIIIIFSYMFFPGFGLILKMPHLHLYFWNPRHLHLYLNQNICFLETKAFAFAFAFESNYLHFFPKTFYLHLNQNSCICTCI